VLYMLSPVRPYVCPSDGGPFKTVEDRIVQFSPYDSSIPPVFAR